MKRNILNLIIVLLTTSVFISSCKKDKFAPKLTLKLEPYTVYYEDQKYVLYDEQGNKNENIPSYVEQQGDIQSYIDLNTLLAYTVDDKGEFWSAEYLNANYKYPEYRVSSYSDTEPAVSITFDESIGVEGEDGIDLANVGTYTFTYTATDEGETSKKIVHLRVYNSYTTLAGLYVSSLKILDWASSSRWTDNYGFGEAKVVKFDVDGSVDRKVKLNRILNNRNLKGVIKGDSTSFPTSCVLGDKRYDIHDVIEKVVQGEVVENDSYIATFAPDERDTVTTLVVLANKTENNFTTGRIKNIKLLNNKGDSIQVPLVGIQYLAKRYIRDNNTTDYITSDGQTWKELKTGAQDWKGAFQEVFIKQVYWTEENRNTINTETEHLFDE